MSVTYFDESDRPTDEEIRAYVREECDGMVLIGDWSGRSTKKGLHIPSENGDYGQCEFRSDRSDWREKPLSVYPEGSKDWCTICLAYIWPERSNIEVKQR